MFKGKILFINIYKIYKIMDKYRNDIHLQFMDYISSILIIDNKYHFIVKNY